MSRDWANEPWRKLYVRESPADFALVWQARTLRPLLLMYCDRMGLLEVEPGPRRIRLVAGLLRLPDDYVKAGIDDLLDDGSLVELGQGYFFPKFEEAQRARKTVAQRVREHRERKALLLRNVSSGNKKLQIDTDKKRRDRNIDSSTPLLAAPRRVQAPGAIRAVAAVVKNKQDTLNKFQTAAATAHSSAELEREGLEPRELDFMHTWNTERRERKRSEETLSEAQRPLLAALLDATEREAGKRNVTTEDALTWLVVGVLEGMKVPELATVLSPRVWPRRLDDAIASIAVERARPRRL